MNVSESAQQPCVCLEVMRKGKYVRSSANNCDAFMAAECIVLFCVPRLRGFIAENTHS